MFTTDHKLVEHLTSEQEHKLNEYSDAWLNCLTSTEPADRSEVERGIRGVYRRICMFQPAILWCQSPWQLAVMPLVLQSWGRNSPARVFTDALGNSSSEEDELASALLAQTNIQISAEVEHHLRLSQSAQSIAYDIWESEVCLKEAAYPISGMRYAFVEGQGGLGARLLSQMKAQYESYLLGQIVRHRMELVSSEVWQRIDSRLRHRLQSHPSRFMADQLDSELKSRASERMDFELSVQFGDRPPTERELHIHAQPGSNLNRLLTWRSIKSDTWWSGEMNGISSYGFLTEVLGCSALDRVMDGRLGYWLNIARGGIAYLFYEDFCFVCERPLKFSLDERGRPHHNSGPAIEFSDGYKSYSWHGVPVAREVVEHPETITLKNIDDEENTEVRRVLVDRYGCARYLKDCGAQKIHEDDFGALYRRDVKDDEPLVMVKVANATPEPDGSYKDYFLRVPPEMTTARQAVAWTFDLDAWEYQPAMET